MKKLTHVVLCLIALTATAAFSQDKSTPATQPAPPALTRFDLDFPGGSPTELIAAIQKAMGRPLNAVIPAERANLKMPPLKMKGVNVEELFQALVQTSSYFGGNTSTNPVGIVSYGFDTRGARTDSSIWYFFFNGPPPTQSHAGVYLLTPYLDQGLSVDDITTAIQTAWKMLGYSTTPQLSFHKETKLLIAVGEWQQLSTISDVLNALRAPPPPPPAKPEPQNTK
jgi:hypothetical protein